VRRQDVQDPTSASALLVDLYELTMGQSYFDRGMHERPATFSLFARHLPAGWGYFLAAGLDGALSYLEELSFTDHELAYLERTGLFRRPFLEYLRTLRFRGDVRALPEGTAFFPHEPLLEIEAPAVAAQLVESAVLNELHFQSLVASKASRCVEAAAGRTLVDFGLRRAHGADAALKAARASYLAGFDATSDVLAGMRYGIPVAGTMAHSFVQAFEDEQEAFDAFLCSYPGATLLVDTYESHEGVIRAIAAARETGASLHAVRLDSGDLLVESLAARRLLDAEGFEATTVFASGNLDEHELERLLRAGAPIDGFGVGSRLGTVADAPYLDMAYKLVAFDGRPVLKLSPGKATWPGPKQVWRRRGADGTALGDVVAVAGEELEGESLLRSVMRGGRRLGSEPLSLARERARRERASLLEGPRRLRARPYAVAFSPALEELRASVRRQRDGGTSLRRTAGGSQGR
jgi:nicotinate phosphoribosyltransferase